MKYIALLVMLTTAYTLTAQPIDYTIPKDLEERVSAKEYRFFLKKVVKEVKKYYTILTVEQGRIDLKDPSESGEKYTLYVDNLLMTCLNNEKKNWPTIIEDHFKGLEASRQKREELDFDDYEMMKPYLSIRIYPRGFVEQYGQTNKMVVREDIAGTYSVLMLDLPTAFIPAYELHFNNWQADKEEVFALAQQNINKQKFESESSSFDLEEGGSFEVHFIEEENYAASIALDLDNNAPEFLGEWGAVVAIPHKGVVSLCQVSKEKPLDFMLFIQSIKGINDKLYNEHPQPVTKEFFWYYEGVFTPIPIIFDDKTGQMNVVAPLQLAELMGGKK